MQVAALYHFFMDVAHRQHARYAVPLRHHGARAAQPRDQAFGSKLFDRAVHRHAAHAKLLLQGGFAGHGVAGLPDAAGDLRLDEGFDLFKGG